jgi:apolipoprotein N-acyltransferase
MRFMLAILSAILLVLSFPPFNQGWIAWFALVPFLYSVIASGLEKKLRMGNRKKPFLIIPYSGLFLSCLIFGLIFYGGTLHWFYTIFGWFSIVFILLLTAYIYITARLIAYLHRKFGDAWLPLIIPAVWVAIEFFKSEGWWLKFSWMNLGYTQHDMLPLLQSASIIGQYGITALILFTNAMILLAWMKKSWKIFAVPSAIMLALSAHGLYALSESHQPDVEVVLIQDELSDFEKYMEILRESPAADLYVLPEYAIPSFLAEQEEYLGRLIAFTLERDAYLIVGSKERSRGSKGFFNTAFLIDQNGLVGSYHKMNPIQFFQDGDPGEEFNIFETRLGNVGILICYDMDYSYVSRGLTRQGAELLVIPTYDAAGWGKVQHLQHSAMASMRAVENGRYIARASSSGISMIVDPQGRISSRLDSYVTGSIIGMVQPVKMMTFYSRIGYLFPWLCVGAVVLILIMPNRKQ